MLPSMFSVSRALVDMRAVNTQLPRLSTVSMMTSPPQVLLLLLL